MESHQYVQSATLATIVFLGIAGTIAAVAYAMMQTVSAADLPTLVDRVVERGDGALCSSAESEEDKKECYVRTFPVVSTLDRCSRIPYTDVAEQCRQYYAALQTLEAKADTLRQSFTYPSVQLELTMKDGETSRITALVADDDAKRIQGLSYVPRMSKEEGMLFVFPTPMQDMAFHMKDMLMPLDIVYITKDWTPVQSFRNVPSCAGTPADPCPLLLRRGGDVQYVLEITPRGKEVVGVRLIDDAPKGK